MSLVISLLASLSGKSLQPWQTCTKWPVCPWVIAQEGQLNSSLTKIKPQSSCGRALSLETCMWATPWGHSLCSLHVQPRTSPVSLFSPCVFSEVLSKHDFQPPCKIAWKQFISAHLRAESSSWPGPRSSQFWKTMTPNPIVYLGITGEMSLLILWQWGVPLLEFSSCNLYL